MNKAQIDSLRDFAIEHLPRAQAVRDKLKQRGEDEFYSALSYVAYMTRGYAGAAAEEVIAANMLLTVCHLRMTQEPALSNADKKILHERLTGVAKELCALTGCNIPWLEALPSAKAEDEALEEERNQHEPAIPHKRLDSIAGRYVSTEEAASWLCVTAQTLREWRTYERGGVGTGDLKPVKPKGSSKLRWSGDEIIAYLQKQQKTRQ